MFQHTVIYNLDYKYFCKEYLCKYFWGIYGYLWLCVCVFECVHFVIQSCPCNPMNCSLPGSSVHGILQARILEPVAISDSRGSSRPKGLTRISCVSCIGQRVLYHWATWETLSLIISECTKFNLGSNNTNVFEVFDTHWPFVFQNIYNLSSTDIQEYLFHCMLPKFSIIKQYLI